MRYKVVVIFDNMEVCEEHVFALKDEALVCFEKLEKQYYRRGLYHVKLELCEDVF